MPGWTRNSSLAIRIAIAAVIFAATLTVSAIWQKMGYTFPVLAVLLFLAASMKDLGEGSTKRNLDEDAPDVDMDDAAVS